MSVSEERLRFIQAKGATVAMTALGWTQTKKTRVCVFFKVIDGVYEIVTFPKTPTLVLTRLHVAEILDNVEGLTTEEFLEEYIKAYDGEPPLMPL